MIGWTIAGTVIIIILLLLMTSAKVRFEYSDELRLKISWTFLTLVSIPAKTEGQKKKDKLAKKTVKAAAEGEEKASGGAEQGEASGESDTPPAGEEKAGEPKQDKKPSKKSAANKLTLKDIWELVKLVWDSLGKPLKHLLRATRIDDFRLYVVVGGEDAAKAAIKFGAVSAVVGQVLAFLDGCFTLRKPDTDITCDFLSEETRCECSFNARVTVIAAIAFAFWLVGRLVKNYLSRKEAAAAVGKLKKH